MISAKRRHPDPDPEEGIWEQHKSTFLRLYQTERKTLREVKEIMESEHGFPENSLLTYETKLRDELHLRKKLKKTDWVSVHHHRLKRGDKPTGVYLNGTEIPQHKVWKEIRRSGAQLVGNVQDIPLPRDVVVRTPPVGYLVSPTPQTLYEKHISLSQQLPISPTMTLSIPSSSKDTVFYPRDTVQLPQTNLDIPIDPQFRGVKVMESLEFTPKYIVTALSSTPWAKFTNRLRRIVITNRLPGECNGALDNWIKSGPLLLPSIGIMRSELELLNPREAAFPLHQLSMSSNTTLPSTLTFEMNTFYLLTAVIYLISNNKICSSLPDHEDITELLFSRVPQTVFKSFFREDMPTVRATWQYLADYSSKRGYRDVFTFLMQIGLLYRSWITPRGASYLSFAVSMNALSVIRGLLKIGVRADGMIDDNEEPAVVEAAATGNLECLKLLISVCDVNRDVWSDADGALSTFDLFILALREGNLISQKRDHAYPSNSFRGLPSGEGIRVEFSLENKVQSQALDIILQSGANVDTLWRLDERMGRIFETIYERWGPTILEQSYYMDVKLFYKLAPYSTQATRLFFRPDVCLFAKQGCKSFRDYWTSQPDRADSDGTAFLESVFAEQFIYEYRHMDTAIIGSLLEFGIGPNITWLGLDSRYILWYIVTQARKNGFTEASRNIFSIVLQSGALIDLVVLEAGVEKEGVEILKLLKEFGADVGKYGGLALSTAARLDNYEAVSWLLEAGANINAAMDLSGEVGRPESWSVILLASTSTTSIVCSIKISPDRENPRIGLQLTNPASLGMIDYLLNRGAELKTSPQDLNAVEFLHRVIDDGWWFDLTCSDWFDLIRLFLSKLDSYDLSSPGLCLLEDCITLWSSIYCDATKNLNMLGLFRSLHAHGAPMPTGSVLPNLIDKEVSPDLVQEFLECYPDVDKYGEVYRNGLIAQFLNPLQAAALRGNEDLFDELIAMGANINMPAFRDNGLTALQAAASRAHVGLVKRLVHRGADVNAPRSEINGQTALQAACGFYANSKTERANMIEVIQFLIKEGADVDANSGPRGRSPFVTALCLAAERGDLEVALILIQGGADVNPTFQRWNTDYLLLSPLDAAAQEGRLDMVQFLLDLGALSHDRGETGYDRAIRVAERRGFFAVADLIRQHHAEDCKLLGTNFARTFMEEDSGNI